MPQTNQKTDYHNKNAIDYLVDLITKNADKSNKTFVVSIDGSGGSGKSTLAKKLNKLLPNSSILEMDDFYNQNANFQHYDFARLIQQVLEPIVNNHQNILFQRTIWSSGDWSKNTISEEYFTLEVGDFLIIEGLHSTDEKLSSYLNLKIKTQCQVDVSHQRGIKRDIEEYGLDPNTVYEQWQKWAKQHTIQDFSQETPADIIINTENGYEIVKNKFQEKPSHIDKNFITLENCLKVDCEASTLLGKITKTILETENKVGVPEKNLQIISNPNIYLPDFFNYINSWYFFNDLTVIELQDWLEKSDESDEKWRIELCSNLINLCKVCSVSNCFDICNYFKSKFETDSKPF